MLAQWSLASPDMVWVLMSIKDRPLTVSSESGCATQPVTRSQDVPTLLPPTGARELADVLHAAGDGAVLPKMNCFQLCDGCG